MPAFLFGLDEFIRSNFISGGWITRNVCLTKYSLNWNCDEKTVMKWSPGSNDRQRKDGVCYEWI